MPSGKRSTPVWLWPNLLSLDAPVVAVLWQGFLAYRFSLPLQLAARFVLGLTVWSIYLIDRLLDARNPPALDEPARHRYYREHSRLMTALLALVVASDASIAIFWLRPAVLRDGLIPLAGVLIYLAAFHMWNESTKIPKEIAVAVLFTAGTFLTAWTMLPSARLAWPAAAFFLLCLANMVAIKAWEFDESAPSRNLHPITRWLARTYLLWVPAGGAVCVIAGRNPWYTSIALSAVACVLLFWFGRRFSMEARRALVDGVLLTPLVFLLLR
jgi:hypothetical protein